MQSKATTASALQSASPAPRGPSGESSPATDNADAEKQIDAGLVRKAQSGDRRAFDQLVLRYHKRAAAVAYRMVGNQHDAGEVTQNAFLKAYSSLDSLDKPESFGSWLLRIVNNLALNYRRYRGIRQMGTIDNDSDDDESGSGSGDVAGRELSPAQKLEGVELGQKLQAALQQLGEKQRQALTLFTIEQLPQQEVAEIMKTSVEAVKWHVFQARKKLKELLAEYV
jgi:RNA polymerase sigma-70 factor (ECF subfamily)